jgi:HK97 family phage major capsid protein
MAIRRSKREEMMDEDDDNLATNSVRADDDDDDTTVSGFDSKDLQSLEAPNEEKSKRMSIREVTDEIGKLYENMKRQVEGALAEGKPMTGQEEAKYNSKNRRMSSLIKLRDQHYRMLDSASKATETRSGAIARVVEQRGYSSAKAKRFASTVDSHEYRTAFQTYLTSGNDLEIRALNEGTDSAGGYLPSTEFYATLTQQRFQANAMRQVATVMPLGTFKTDMAIESTFGTASYVAENAQVTDTQPVFSNLIFKPYTLRYFTLVSNELIADAPSRGSGFSIETILANQIGRVVGLREETAFTLGTGSSQPKGIFAYTGGAITTVTASGATSFTAQNLLDVVYALPRQYRQNAKWVMPDAVFAKIRALLQTQAVGGTGGGAFAPFSWSMGDGKLQDGEPDRLLGYPVVCTADGNAITTGKVILAFGDFEYYKIGEREGMSIQTAREAFLGTNQTGYYAFARHDAQCTLPNAFRYLTMA